MSDFRDRLGVQLGAAAASMAAAAQPDFRERLGLQLARAAAELAGAGAPLPVPAMPRSRRTRVRVGAVARPRDFRARYGVQLARAAGALAGERHAPRARPRLPWLTRPIAVGLALTAFAGTAFAAVAIWTPLLGTSQYGYNPGASMTPPPQDQLDALGVLRRAQTDADRGALSQTVLTYIDNFTTGVRTPYVRLLGSSGGLSFVLVPVESRRDATASTGGVPTASPPLENALCLYAVESQGPEKVEGSCWSLADIESGRVISVGDGQLFGLAPDTARTVTVTSLNQPQATAPVASNLFDIALPAGGLPPVRPSASFN